MSAGPAATPSVETRHGLPGLLVACGDNAFVRWEVTDDLADTWWQAGDAVAFARSRRKVRRTLGLLGDAAGVGALLDDLPGIAAHLWPGGPRRRVQSVSVPQHLEEELTRRYEVRGGGDWEWLHTTVAPAEHASHERVRPIDDVARATELSAFLTEHSPTADTEPGTGERWFAIEGAGGSLAAVAAWGRTRAGAPHLSSVAVDTGLRGQGLGRAIVAAVTRMAVAEAGVCTLGMYSHNDVARRLYHSLGYQLDCAWASRDVVV